MCLKFLNDYHFIDNIKLRNLIEVGADISHRYLALLNFLLFNIALWFNELFMECWTRHRKAFGRGGGKEKNDR